MRHKRRINPVAYLAVALLVLVAFSVFATVRILMLSRQTEQLSQQNKTLQSQLGGLEQKYKKLQSDYQTMEDTKKEESSDAKVAYLTFDDGPSKLTDSLISVLDQNHVKATFFVIGINAEKFPGSLKKLTDDGNAVGIHSWTHKYDYIYANTQNFFDDFNHLNTYITQETGVKPTICRFPGGTNNTISNRYSKDIMKKILPQVLSMGIQPYDWNVDSGTAVKNVPPKDKIIDTVTKGCKDMKKVVILFHDADQHQSTIDALPQIISDLRAKGYTFGVLRHNSTTCVFKPS